MRALATSLSPIARTSCHITGVVSLWEPRPRQAASELLGCPTLPRILQGVQALQVFDASRVYVVPHCRLSFQGVRAFRVSNATPHPLGYSSLQGVRCLQDVRRCPLLSRATSLRLSVLWKSFRKPSGPSLANEFGQDVRSEFSMRLMTSPIHRYITYLPSRLYQERRDFLSVTGSHPNIVTPYSKSNFSMVTEPNTSDTTRDVSSLPVDTVSSVALSHVSPSLFLPYPTQMKTCHAHDHFTPDTKAHIEACDVFAMQESVQRNRTGPKPIMFTDQSERHRAIVAQHQEHPFATTRSTAVSHGVSVQTVRHHLHAAGFKTYKPARKIKLSPAHRQARVRFAQMYQNFDWINNVVIFTDEKVFKSDKDGKQILWRKKGQRYEESCMLPCRTSGEFL
ncbi:transposase domain-containing protein [Phthorimaea operculella]|nr:transposase domain-containing protein [Phthorimaea operculella]